MAHPDGEHIIYPLGCTIIVKELSTQKQTFLSGHSDNVSCVACSPSGEYLASGQVTYMGFKADVIVWKFKERALYCRLSLHKVKVQAIAFSPNDKYLATLGGQDDNRYVHVAPYLAVCITNLHIFFSPVVLSSGILLRRRLCVVAKLLCRVLVLCMLLHFVPVVMTCLSQVESKLTTTKIQFSIQLHVYNNYCMCTASLCVYGS